MKPGFEITDDIVNSHIDRLIDVIEGVQKHRLTVLVGGNGTGKSLIRKQLNVRFIKEYDKKRNVVREISMQMRTEPRPSLGALSSAMHDSPTSPTSIETWHLMTQAMGKHEFSMDEPYYLVFDEMEIGMSRESIAGCLAFLKENLPDWLENTLGVMVITHSDAVARTLCRECDADFVDIGYDEISHDLDAWLEREIVPTDFDWLREWSNKLFHAIYDRSAPLKE